MNRADRRAIARKGNHPGDPRAVRRWQSPGPVFDFSTRDADGQQTDTEVRVPATLPEPSDKGQ